MNKFKKMLVAGLVCTTAVAGGLCLTGCGNADNNSGETEIHKIYDKAVAAGYEGTYEEWLASIKGEKGDTGETGAQGIPGENGKQVEFNVTETHIQWRYEGDTEWTNLIALSELKGGKGDKGDTGAQGEKGEKGDKGDTGAQGIQGEKGDSGKSAYEIYCGYKVNYEGSETDWLNDMISGKLVLVATKDFGDVNGDGEVNNKDLSRLQEYLGGKDVEINLAVADVDLSGNIDERDLDVLMKKCADWDISLPITYKWGDVNMDGKVDETDYNLMKDDTSYNALTAQQKYLASCGRDYTREQSLKTYETYLNNNLPSINFLWGDVNGDGKVSTRDASRLQQYLGGQDVEINLAVADLDLNGKVDAADLSLLFKKCSNWDISLPITYKWGDVNGDGEVNNKDLSRLQEYLGEKDVEINLAVADLDLNGEIDERDLDILMKKCADWDISLPLLYQWGDLNLDGKVDETDYNLLNSEESYNELTQLQKYLGTFGYDYEREEAVTLFRQYLDGDIDTMAPATEE